MRVEWLVWWNWSFHELMFRIMTRFGSHYLQIWILSFLHAFPSKHRNLLKWSVFFVCFATEVYRLVYSYAVSVWFEESLWSRSSHSDMTWRITVTVIFASNIHSIIHLDFYQSALKIWKSSSWMTQKKHDLMTQLSAAFSIESLISYNSQFPVWWLTANCVTARPGSESIYIFLSFFFICRSRWVDEKKLNAKDVVVAIALNIKFRNFFDFLHFILHSHSQYSSFD